MSDVDVIVVGGGFAGLSAAMEFARVGVSFRLLEASRQLGGRVRTVEIDESRVDLGAEFIGPPHARLRRLIQDFGLELEPTVQPMERIAWRLKDRVVARIPPIGLDGFVALATSVGRLDRLARLIRPTEPWRSPSASELDAQSLGAWLRDRRVPEDVYQLFEATVGAFAGASIERVSLLQILWWIRRAGGVVRAMRSGSEFRVIGGMQQIAVRMAAGLDGALELETPVDAIEQSDEGVCVRADERCWCGRFAIVATPVTMLEGIRFDPPLSTELLLMVRTLRYGAMSKVVAVFKPGSAPVAAVGGRPIRLAVSHGRVATGFAIEDDAARSEDTLIEDLRLATGVDLPPAWGLALNWTHERFARGSYVVFEPGQLTRYGPLLKRPQARIYFAGAERSSWPHSVEGALESGTEVAHRILQNLGHK